MKDIDFKNYSSRAWLEDEQSYRSTGYICCYGLGGEYEVRLADCFRSYFLKGTRRGSKTFCKKLDSVIKVLNRESTCRMIESSVLYKYSIRLRKQGDKLTVTVFSKQKRSGYEKIIIELHQLNDQDESGFYRKLDRISNELDKFKAHILYCVNK